jgi:hypothetical protein
VLTGTSGWAPHPLTFSAAVCIEEVGGWCSRNNIHGDEMEYVFEAGDPNEPEIRRLMSDIADNAAKRADFRYAGWSFGSKRLVGLQAADWIAYESFLWGHREILPRYGESPRSLRPLRRSLTELARIENRITIAANVEEVLAEVRNRFERHRREQSAIRDSG